uniref:Uncharacterized protein n=1 Tax=Utricularia reniformis TaxID=192314 RepID=A0A1Y0AZF5_9LAMI|nr:hypothetical protein AEK19_MT0246 [Utricularia reniformis]ART30524.1 hypothetical protein AEK19_MT0246 [Utricularia reniformis]
MACSSTSFFERKVKSCSRFLLLKEIYLQKLQRRAKFLKIAHHAFGFRFFGHPSQIPGPPQIELPTPIGSC